MDNMKKQAAVSVSIASNYGRIEVTFADGHSETLRVADLTPEIGAMALCHGLKQKIVDAAAMSRNPVNGQPASAAEKRDACVAVIDRLRAGQWNAERGGDGTGAGSLLFRALCVAYPAKTREQVSAFVAALDKKQQAALRGNPKIAAIIDELRTKNASGVDTDGLLDQLAD